MSYRPIRGEEVLYFDEDEDKWLPGIFIMESSGLGYIVKEKKEGMYVSVERKDIRGPGLVEESNPNVTFKSRERE